MRLQRIETLLTADKENIKQRLFHIERVLLSGQIIRYIKNTKR